MVFIGEVGVLIYLKTSLARRAGARRSIRGVVMLVVRRRGGDAPHSSKQCSRYNINAHYTINPLTTITRLNH